MKKSLLFAVATCTVAAMPQAISAQEEVTAVTVEETVGSPVNPKTHYYVDKSQNWFLQFGAGVAMPLVEGRDVNGDRTVKPTANYNVGFGKWFSPYFGWRLSFNGGALHWQDQAVMHHAKYVGANADVMWDMFNSLGGVSQTRVFSIVPFVGIGGTYVWDFRPAQYGNVIGDNGKSRSNSWTLPVSAGLQFRFRLCKYVDFFAEGRASMYGDNFNNFAVGRPVDFNFTATGGFTVTFGGREYETYNPSEYLGYIATLNNQVNELRGALETTAAALSVAESQLPCPEVVVEETVAPAAPATLMATVRFSLNSATIRPSEMVNIYNVAEWMKQYPDQKVTIVGYADKDTGTSTYNMKLSKRRAENVYKVLVDKYGINPDRLSVDAEGSSEQLYKQNDWNRIVIFVPNN